MTTARVVVAADAADAATRAADEMPRLSLDTVGGGAARELFEQELDKVLENVLDPNTEPTARRSVMLTVTLTPSDDRTQVAVAVEAHSKVAAFRGATSVAFVGRRGGRAVATPHDPRQMQMQWDREAATEGRPHAAGTGT